MTAEQRFRDAETPVDGALEIASVLERDAGNSASFHELRSAFDAACKGLDAQDSRRQFLAWEEGLFAYQLPETPDTKVDELVPFCQIGERRYPPRVEDFPDEVIAYFRQRLTRSQNPSARARLVPIQLDLARIMDLLAYAVPKGGQHGQLRTTSGAHARGAAGVAGEGQGSAPHGPAAPAVSSDCRGGRRSRGGRGGRSCRLQRDHGVRVGPSLQRERVHDGSNCRPIRKGGCRSSPVHRSAS
jgi:hypothetical protein